MAIIQVTYSRTYNLGSYESLRLEAVSSADGDSEAAYVEARAAVEAEYARHQAARQEPKPAEYKAPPASAAQLGYIARLQDELSWNGEQLLAYAYALDIIDPAAMDKFQ